MQQIWWFLDRFAYTPYYISYFSLLTLVQGYIVCADKRAPKSREPSTPSTSQHQDVRNVKSAHLDNTPVKVERLPARSEKPPASKEKPPASKEKAPVSKEKVQQLNPESPVPCPAAQASSKNNLALNSKQDPHLKTAEHANIHSHEIHEESTAVQSDVKTEATTREKRPKSSKRSKKYVNPSSGKEQKEKPVTSPNCQEPAPALAVA